MAIDGSGNATKIAASSGVAVPVTYFGNRGGRQASFRPETKALIARMSPTPSRARQIVINRLITSLIRDGVWAKLDVLRLRR